MTTFRNTGYFIQVTEDGSFEHCQVNRVKVFPDGSEAPAPPTNYTDVEMGALLSDLSTDIAAENSSLVTQITNANTDRDAATSQVAGLQSQIISLQSDVSTAIANTQTQLDAAGSVHAGIVSGLQAQIAGLNTIVASLESKVASLQAIAPFDPRKITVSAFLNRLTPASMLMLFTDADPVVQSISAMLTEWSANQWPIFFDSEQFQQAMGYLQQAGKLSSERVAAITVDATRAESPV